MGFMFSFFLLLATTKCIVRIMYQPNLSQLKSSQVDATRQVQWEAAIEPHSEEILSKAEEISPELPPHWNLASVHRLPNK